MATTVEYRHPEPPDRPEPAEAAMIASLRVVPLLLALTALAAPVRAQEAEPEPDSATLPGRTEWGIVLGGGDGKVFDPARTDTGLLLGGLRWAHHLGSGPGPLAIVVELLPLFTVSQDPRAWGGGLDLLLRYGPGDGKWRPALIGGAGLAVTHERVPPGETHVNFMPQIGAGLRRMLGDDLAVDLEYRFHHLSNAGLSESNPGINSHMALVVVSWLR